MMKTKNIQGIICLVLFFIFANQAWAAEWILFAKPTSGAMYYDKSSIKEINNNIITVETKKIYNENEKTTYFSDLPTLRQKLEIDELIYDIDLHEIDCVNKRQKLISTNFYNKKNEIIFSSTYSSPKWESFGPDSVGARMNNKVCSMGKTDEIKKEPEKVFQGLTAVDWFNKADALIDDDRYTDLKKAIEYLNNAIKLKPDYADAYNNRGVTYAKLGQYERAIEEYNQAIRLKPNFVFAYSNRGIAYSRLGQYERAIEEYNQAIRLKPDDAYLYSSRATFYAKGLKQYERSIADYNEAIRLKPDYADAFSNRGGSYLLQGNKELGCRDVQKACELGACRLLEMVKGKGDCRSPLSGQNTEPLQSATAIPSDIDVTQTSDDPTYGYTIENPVKVGGSDFTLGPLVEEEYLTHLRDKNFEPFRFVRLGNVGKGSDGHFVDVYKLMDSKDNEYTIYIDMYHPENTPLKSKAPKGMYFWK